MTTVDRIFQLIKENNLTAKEFANIVGLSAGNITDWKTGRAKPSVESLKKIQLNFNVSMEWLLGQSDTKKYVEYKYIEIPENFTASICNGLPDYLIDTIKRITFGLLFDNISSESIMQEIDSEISFNKIPQKHIEQIKSAILFLYDYNKKYDFLEKVEQKKFFMCPVYGKISAGQPNWAEECLEGYLPIDPNLMGIVSPEETFFLLVNGESMNKVIRNGAYALIRKQDVVENGEICAVLVNGFEATLKKFSKQGDLVILEPISNDPSFTTQVYNKDTQIKILGKYIGKFEINK